MWNELLLLALGVVPPGQAHAGKAVSASVAVDSSASRRGKTWRPKRPDDTIHPESCRRLPAGQRLVKLNLKPGTNVADLVAWISSITCLELIVPGTVTATDKKVTLFAPEPVTPEEAYLLFLDALDSVGLTVVRTGRLLQIIESAKAKSAPIPFHGADDQRP